MDGCGLDATKYNDIKGDSMATVNGVQNGHPLSNGQDSGEEDAMVVPESPPSIIEKLKNIGQPPPNAKDEIWPLPPAPEILDDNSETPKMSRNHSQKQTEKSSTSQKEPENGQSSPRQNGQASDQEQRSDQSSQQEPQGGQPSHPEPQGGQPSHQEPQGGQPSHQEPKGGQPSHQEPQGGQPSYQESQGGQLSYQEPQGGQPSHQETQSGQASQRKMGRGQPPQKDTKYLTTEQHHSQNGKPIILREPPVQQQGSPSRQLQGGQPLQLQKSQNGQWSQPPQVYQKEPQRVQWSQLQNGGQQSQNEFQNGQQTEGDQCYLTPGMSDIHLRRARSYCDVHDYQGGGQEVGSHGQPISYLDVDQPDYIVYDPPRNKRHSWAPQISIVEPEVVSGRSEPRSRFTVVPVRSHQRNSYCGSPPSVHELDQYLVAHGGRASTGQAPNIYLLTPPERPRTPFTFSDRDDQGLDGLRRSVESLSLSLGSQPNSPTLRPLLDGQGQKQNILQIPTDNGQSMVLQLVLPQSQNTNNSGQGNSIAPSPQLEAITCPPSTENYDTNKTMDTLQTASPTCTVSPSNSMNALVKPDGQNLYPQLTNGEQPTTNTVNGDAKNKTPLPPPSTPEEEKKTIFTKNLTTMLSSIYAIFIVMMGGVVYVADVLQPLKSYGEIFTIYLTIVGIAWLVFLHVDIRSYLNSMAIWRKHDKRRFFGKDNEGFDKSFDMVDKSEIKPGSNNTPIARPPDSYCFKTGRHSGSFYLKIGAAVFCFGHLIHEGLLLSRQIAYFTSDQKYLNQCSDPIALILSILHPLFSFYQLFMVFKYSNIIINRYKEIARFAIMHIIAANLCLWVNTIIRETEEALAHKASHGNYSTDDDDDDDDDHHHFGFTTHATFIPHSSISSHDEQDSCVTKTILSAFTLQAAPYLYPFTIEYSLLQVGIWFIVWYNIGDNESIEAEKHHLRHASGDDGTSTYEDMATGDSFTSNLVIHVDCHSANRGLFAGLFILLATVVSVIIFFVAMTNAQYIRTGVVINNVSDTVLLLLMIFSVAFAYRQTSNLDFNDHAVTFLDDFLLYIALPCFFLYAIFNVVASIAVNNPFTIVISVLCVIQVTIQTPFIVDGLRRCSNSYLLRFKKPGREIITFLIVCNVACWILETFEIKSYEAHADRIEFYGSFLWTLLSHVTLPLTLFYRFHSSVCLVDMWKSAYEPGDTH